MNRKRPDLRVGNAAVFEWKLHAANASQRSLSSGRSSRGLADFGRTAGKIPVAAKGAHLGTFGFRHDDFRRDPVFGIADHGVLAVVLARNRRDDAVDDLGYLDDPLLVLDLVADRLLLHAEEIPDQDGKQRGCSASLAGKDLGEGLGGVDRGALVDEQAGGPVAAAHVAGNLHDQAEIEARQIGVAIIAVVDPEPCPGLAIALGGRMLAERNHARAEHCAIARKHQFTLQSPLYISHETRLPQALVIMSVRPKSEPLPRGILSRRRLWLSPARPGFLEKCKHRQRRHPDHIHAAHCKHDQHQCPAASEAPHALFHRAGKRPPTVVFHRANRVVNGLRHLVRHACFKR
jgi:hypothetical protein